MMFESPRIRTATPADAEPLAALAERTFRDTFADDNSTDDMEAYVRDAFSLDRARAAGRRTLWLGVWERNARAISFYERWRFATVGEHVFRLGSDDQRDLIMARPVQGAV
jgi:hypothetical protein